MGVIIIGIISFIYICAVILFAIFIARQIFSATQQNLNRDKILTLILAFAICIAMWTYMLAQCYYPIRLYLTGTNKELTINTVSDFPAFKTLAGDAEYDVEEHWEVKTKESNAIIFTYVNPTPYITAHAKIKAFVSEKIQKGFIKQDGENLLSACLQITDTRLAGILVNISAITFFAVLGVTFFLKQLKLNAKFIKEDYKDAPKFVMPQIFLKELLKYTPYLLVLYSLSFILIKGVYSIEGGSQIITCLDVIAIFLLAFLGPPILVFINNYIKINKKVKYYLIPIQTLVLGYFSYKLLKFGITTDLSDKKNLLEILKSALESIT